MTYIHTLDPFAIQLWGDFGIRWYGLGYLAGFYAGYLVMVYLAKKRISLLKPEQVADFIVYIAIGTMVGGRLGYAIFYNPELFLDFRSSLPFWGVLAVNEGGMASHGGMIGITFAAYLYGRKVGVTPFHLWDLIVLTGPFGVSFVRVANFINAELLGRVAPEGAWWTVKFPSEILSWKISEKATLGPAVKEVGVTLETWNQWIQSASAGSQAALNSINITLNKLIISTQQGQQNVIDAIAPLLPHRYPSQLYAAMTEGVFVFAVLWLMWAKPQKPGMIGAAFLWVYGVARIFNEQFRTPDAHLGFQLFDLTRGQWLSVGMLVIGTILLILWSRRDVEKVGGWLSPAKMDS